MSKRARLIPGILFLVLSLLSALIVLFAPAMFPAIFEDLYVAADPPISPDYGPMLTRLWIFVIAAVAAAVLLGVVALLARRKMHAGVVAALALITLLISCPLFSLFFAGGGISWQPLNVWMPFLVLFLPLHGFTLFLSGSRFLSKKSAASG